MKSNKTHAFVSRLILLFFFAVIVAWGGWFWWKYSIAPVDPTNSTPVMFVVSKNEVAKDIAADLEATNLIHSKTGFYLLVKLLGIEKELQYGEFRLNKSMDARTIAQELTTHGNLDVWVTTLEGWRDEEIATQLAKDLDMPEDQFLQYASPGYMFPDTYNIPRDATGAAVAKIFSDTFNTKVTAAMREDAKKTGLTFNQIITLASLLEKEGTDQDWPVIAGILLNRIKLGMPLQVDATLQYALGYQPFEKTWWKKELTDEDKKINSPYNTYTNVGLPPGPISNPSEASIKAAIYPTDSDYLYYLHEPTGAVHYAKTIDDHNANIQKYLQ